VVGHDELTGLYGDPPPVAGLKRVLLRTSLALCCMVDAEAAPNLAARIAGER
jgi:hypothetical protein